MDTPETYIEKLKQFEAKLMASLRSFTAQRAMDAKALIQDRIQERGLNAEEVQLGNYTSEPYKKKRQKGGRQTAYVDLTITRGGAGMFGSTGIIEERTEADSATTVVGGKDEFTANKLEWNSDRYGDVLEVSKKEEQLIVDSFNGLLEELIAETGL